MQNVTVVKSDCAGLEDVIQVTALLLDNMRFEEDQKQIKADVAPVMNRCSSSASTPFRYLWVHLACRHRLLCKLSPRQPASHQFSAKCSAGLVAFFSDSSVPHEVRRSRRQSPSQSRIAASSFPHVSLAVSEVTGALSRPGTSTRHLFASKEVCEKQSTHREVRAPLAAIARSCTWRTTKPRKRGSEVTAR